MTTYGTMIDRIEDEIDDGSLTTQVQKAIKTAILKYQGKRFWFNEARSITFNTVASQEFYTSADDADIPNLLEIDAIKITIATGNTDDLTRKTYQELEAVSDSTTSDEGQPTCFAYYGSQLRLYPIPDAAYAIRISGVFDLGELSLTGDTNAWMTDAETLIRCRAKREIYTHVKREPTAKQEMMEAEIEAFEDLVIETNKRKSTGRIEPTRF